MGSHSHSRKASQETGHAQCTRARPLSLRLDEKGRSRSRPRKVEASTTARKAPQPRFNPICHIWRHLRIRAGERVSRPGHMRLPPTPRPDRLPQGRPGECQQSSEAEGAEWNCEHRTRAPNHADQNGGWRRLVATGLLSVALPGSGTMPTRSQFRRAELWARHRSSG